jgi:hypothetical protein
MSTDRSLTLSLSLQVPRPQSRTGLTRDRDGLNGKGPAPPATRGAPHAVTAGRRLPLVHPAL